VCGTEADKDKKSTGTEHDDINFERELVSGYWEKAGVGGYHRPLYHISLSESVRQCTTSHEKQMKNQDRDIGALSFCRYCASNYGLLQRRWSCTCATTRLGESSIRLTRGDKQIMNCKLDCGQAAARARAVPAGGSGGVEAEAAEAIKVFLPMTPVLSDIPPPFPRKWKFGGNFPRAFHSPHLSARV
jgi:hypothetical protein